MTDYRNDDPAPAKNPTEARQGAKGTRVLWVLVAGLGLCVIALLYFMSTSIEDPPPSPVAETPVGPSSDAVPNNAEPSRLDAPAGSQD